MMTEGNSVGVSEFACSIGMPCSQQPRRLLSGWQSDLTLTAAGVGGKTSGVVKAAFRRTHLLRSLVFASTHTAPNPISRNTAAGSSTLLSTLCCHRKASCGLLSTVSNPVICRCCLLPAPLAQTAPDCTTLCSNMWAGGATHTRCWAQTAELMGAAAVATPVCWRMAWALVPWKAKELTPVVVAAPGAAALVCRGRCQVGAVADLAADMPSTVLTCWFTAVRCMIPAGAGQGTKGHITSEQIDLRSWIPSAGR